MEPQNDSGSAENEVKKWLQVALAEENLKNLAVDIAGNSDKGDGYVGEIIFVVATGTDEFGENKKYDLVLKCSKSSAALMESFPMREIFAREMWVYEKIFPTFRKFEIERGIAKPFDSVPKCYGTYSDGFRYVIALENLKKIGYDLWRNGTPLTRRHIDLVIKEYAKFHAISVAMREKEPEKFGELIDELTENIFEKSSDFIPMFEKTVEEAGEMFKDEFSEDVFKKMLTLKDKVRYLCLERAIDEDDLSVITHGDCWNNNFLHKHEDAEKSIPSKVAMLDWQISRHSSPVDDLSYFLFSCISEQDITDMDTILRTYYQNFSDYSTKLGSTFTETYPVEKLLEEWKKYSPYGLMFCFVPLKAAYSSTDDLPDMAKSADRGENLGTSFTFEVTDKIGCKNRYRPLVRYAVESGII